MRADNSSHWKDRVDRVKPQQQGSKSRSSSSVGARVQKREGKIARATHSRKGYAREYTESLRVTTGDFSGGDEDAIPEDESIVAPAFLTSRCSSRKALVADASVQPATAAFCAASTLSAAAVAKTTASGPQEVTAPAVPAEGTWFAIAAEAKLLEDTFRVAFRKRELVAGEGAASAGARQLNSGDSSGCLCNGKRRSAWGAAGRGCGLGPAGLPSAASCYLGEQLDPPYESTSGSGSARLVVAVPLVSGGGSGAKHSNSGAAAGKARGGSERASWGSRWHEEGTEGEEGEEASLAAHREEGIRKCMSATAVAERARELMTISVDNSGSSDFPTAAAPGALLVYAAARVADCTRRDYLGDRCVVGTRSASSVNERSNRGGSRAAATHRGGEGLKVPPAGGGKGGEIDVAVTSARNGGGRGGLEVDTTAGGRRLYGARVPGGERDFQFGGAGGPGTSTSSSSRASSSLPGGGSEMAAGGERGRPGDLLLCAASGGGGTGSGGGDLKAAGCVGTLRGNDFRYNSRSAGTVNVGRAATVMNRPTRVEAGRQRFLILDSPSDENLPAYIEEMKAFNVMHLVRTCEATYDDALVRDAGICTHEWIFPDGEPPPEEVIDEWLALCNSVASQPGAEAIAVHCVAGLGRAPVLVAVALIEKGMDPMDAIMFIRERRKGAINRRQLQFLKSYRRRSHMQRCCIKRCDIM